MDLLVNIAGIPICISGDNFLARLNTNEKKLISCFIEPIHFIKHATEKLIFAKIKVIPHDCYLNQQIPYYLKKKISSYFSFQGNEKAKSILNVFIKYIYPALDNSEIKKIADAIENRYGNIKIILGYNSLLLFNSRFRSCDIFLKEARAKETKWIYYLSALKFLLRLIFSSEQSGIVLHAASLEDNGLGYTFVGPGQFGKSTVVKLLNASRVLSDDTTIIKRVHTDYKLFSNPWRGINEYTHMDIAWSKKPVSLKAVFFIKPAKKTQMKKITPKQALATLIYRDRNFQQIGFCDTPSGFKHFFCFSLELTKHIPAFLLSIRKSPEFKKEFRNLIDYYLK